MLNREDWLMIREMRAKGCYLSEIAERMGCSERTVRRALKRGGPPPRRRAGTRASKLDPYKALVRREACLAPGGALSGLPPIELPGGRRIWPVQLVANYVNREAVRLQLLNGREVTVSGTGRAHRITVGGVVLQGNALTAEIARRQGLFLALANVFDPQTPPPEPWLEVLYDYVLTDAGAKMAEKVRARWKAKVALGLLKRNGYLSDRGKDQQKWSSEPYYPFKITRDRDGKGTGVRAYVLQRDADGTEYTALGLHLVAPGPRERFATSGQWVSPVAVLHHEMAHTRFGEAAGEVRAMDEYENPLRLMYGYRARERYCYEDGRCEAGRYEATGAPAGVGGLLEE